MDVLLARRKRDVPRYLPQSDAPVGVEGLSGGPVTTHATRHEGRRLRLEPPRVGGQPVPTRPGRKVRLQYRRLRVPCVATGVIVEGEDDGLWVEVHTVERLQRRLWARVPLQVDVEVEVPAAEPGGDPEYLAGVTEDISAGGALVRTDEELERGWELRVWLVLPGEDEEREFRARVVHTSEDERGGGRRRHRAGVEFLGVDHEAREHLVRFTLARERELRRRQTGLDR
ncbi:MAG: PilZ domain-containing protein [Thermoleophilia bacterium]